MRLPRKAYEETWRDEIACRWSAWKTIKCGKWLGHRWTQWVWTGPSGWSLDGLTYQRRERTCRVCRCLETDRVPMTTGTASSTLTVTWN